MENYNEAQDYLYSAFNNLKKFYGEKLIVAQVYTELAFLSLKLDNTKNCLLYFDKSLHIYLNVLKFDKKHKEVSFIYDSIKQINSK